ncbi:MAG: sugar phosphate isomerase/epimerase [Defluviitaleaceae bacterium]|nr:sugar phosphate isomerase/epimerase [Defluviitaleaceae bacterium]
MPSFKADLGINMGFAVNRYIEPEVWAKVVAEDLGLFKVQFVADLLNPSLPDEIIDSQIKRIKNACANYGIEVESMFTCGYTRINHFLHPDAEARAYWLEWFKKFLEMGARLGAKNSGSHFGIMTFDVFNNRYDELLEAGVTGWQKLSRRAKELGYECLIFEPMSVPREMGNTVAEAKKLMDMVNADAGVPLRCCLDVGHAPDPSERDPYPWIEALGAVSPVVHLQQTVLHKSHHWPFTDEYNKQGIITPEKVVAALKKSGAEKTFFAFEISHREHHDTDFRIIADLKQSADYWKEGLAKCL